MSTPEEFQAEVRASIATLARDSGLHALTQEWMARVSGHRYAHNFTWLGLPIIQCPQDIVALQEIVWRMKPDLIVETGIARGGSLIFYASLLEVIGGGGLVVGVDIDVRPHNRAAIEQHPLS
jgi:cephalosporin hydroxylase